MLVLNLRSEELTYQHNILVSIAMMYYDCHDFTIYEKDDDRFPFLENSNTNPAMMRHYADHGMDRQL